MLELLVALSLLAIIGAALARSTDLGVQVWRRAETYPAIDQSVILRAHLRRWIEEMKPYQLAFGARQQVVGTANTLSFMTSSWIGLPGNEPETKVILEVFLNEDDTSALRITLEALAEDGSVSHREERLLVDRAERIRLRYFSQPKETTAGDGWEGSWGGEGRLPTLIAIHVTPGEGGEIWPPLIVAPKLD